MDCVVPLLLVVMAGASLCLPSASCAEGAVVPSRPETVSVVDLPIEQLRLPDGGIRYSVPLIIDGQGPVQTMLDTGSVGLRILDIGARVTGGRVAQADRHYGFSSGVLFNGALSDAEAAIDGRGVRVPVQRVTSVTCQPGRPMCPASKVAAGDFRIGGDGVARVGFEAILGVGPARQDGYGLPNPLQAMGFGSWSIELPLPGAAGPGHLRLYRGQDVPDGFAPVAADARGRLSGCIAWGEVAQPVCGPILFDTGVVGIVIHSPAAENIHVWQPGTDARLTVDGDSSWRRFRTGGMGSPARVAVRPLPGKSPSVISAGVLPYFFFDVFYADGGRIAGLKARQQE